MGGVAVVVVLTLYNEGPRLENTPSNFAGVLDVVLYHTLPCVSLRTRYR